MVLKVLDGEKQNDTHTISCLVVRDPADGGETLSFRVHRSLNPVFRSFPLHPVTSTFTKHLARLQMLNANAIAKIEQQKRLGLLYGSRTGFV